MPDVIAEVKNKRQIRRLCVLPFDLQVREPKAENVKHCVEFAKRTGDYASLSGIDIKVISLAYELEIENVGSEHLRTEPVVSRIVASKEKPEEFQDNTKLAGWYNPAMGDDNEDSDEDASDEESDDESFGNDKIAKDNTNLEEANATEELKEEVDEVKKAIEKQLLEECPYNEQDEVSQEELEKCFAQMNCEPTEGDKTCDILIATSNMQSDSEDFVECAERDDITSPEANDRVEDMDEDESSWITPSNLKKVKKSLEGKVEDDVIPLVACMTTDYALQNVLKQLNLHVSALNGRIIKHLRTYILRCYACFKTTSIMTKVFCPNCGNKTLKRVAVSLDENGKQVVS